MNFQFDSIQAFWNMSGHGPYVWAAYGIFLGVITGLTVQTTLRKKRIASKVHLAALRAQLASEK